MNSFLRTFRSYNSSEYLRLKFKKRTIIFLSTYRDLKMSMHRNICTHILRIYITQTWVNGLNMQNIYAHFWIHLKNKFKYIQFKFFRAKNACTHFWMQLLINNDYIVLNLKYVWPHQWHSGNAQNWKTGGARFKSRSRLST